MSADILEAIRRDECIGKASDYSSGFWYLRLIERGEQMKSVLQRCTDLERHLSRVIDNVQSGSYESTNGAIAQAKAALSPPPPSGEGGK